MTPKFCQQHSPCSGDGFDHGGVSVPPVISSLVSDVTVPRVSGPQHSPGSTQSLKYQNRDQTQNTDHKMDCGSIIFTISYFYPLP